MNLRNLPLYERPRERLLAVGAENLSLTELLAILLTTGTKEKSVLELAHDIVVRFGTLENLLSASLEEITEIKGIGKAKAIQLKAAFGIALKTTPKPLDTPQIHAREAYELVRSTLAHEKQEILLVVLKDTRARLISVEKISIGTLTQVIIHPREVFFPVIRHRAYSFILAHNHPSGDPTPSEDDIRLTRHIAESSNIMGIRLDDHLIIGGDRFVSLRESGYFKDSGSSRTGGAPGHSCFSRAP